jgi:prepilin-type N-terminal cleavage/methylation domain-containing protein
MRHYNSGFNLIELMCCLVIVAILIFIVLPFSQVWLATARVKRVTQEIEYAVRYARNIAHHQNKSTVLLPLKQDNWSSGMQLSVAGSQDYPQKISILYVWKWGFPSLHVEWLGFQRQQKIVFSNALTHGSCSGHFTVRSGRITRKLVLNRLGRVHKYENQK